MTSQLLASELANLIQESKRKHNDLRQVRTPDTLIHRQARIAANMSPGRREVSRGAQVLEGHY
jgi:hypothetical protein